MADPEPITGPIAEILREARENLAKVASEETVQKMICEREREIRAERIRPHRRLVTDEDFRRIVRGELDTRAAEIVTKFLAAPESNPRARVLWLAGSVGVGKTVAAIGAIADVGGRVASADQVRRAYGQEHDEARELRVHLEDCGLLVVDDVGTARSADEEKRALYELVNARQGGRRRTILTGNLDAHEIAARYDERLLSRVRHVGAIVDCGKKSLRRGAA